MSDLISRQTVLRCIKESRDNIDWGQSEDGDAFLHYTGALYRTIASEECLPSAESEIIRCKDCKHFEYDHPYIIQGIPILGHEVCNAWGDGCKTDENGYCFMAERKEE